MASDQNRSGFANFEGTVYLLPKPDTMLKHSVYVHTQNKFIRVEVVEALPYEQEAQTLSQCKR